MTLSNLRREITSFCSTMFDCLSLSWKVSHAYTLLRLAYNLISPLLTMLCSLQGKYILDLLSGYSDVNGKKFYLILFLAGIFLICTLQELLKKAQVLSDLHCGRRTACF